MTDNRLHDLAITILENEVSITASLYVNKLRLMMRPHMITFLYGI